MIRATLTLVLSAGCFVMLSSLFATAQVEHSAAGEIDLAKAGVITVERSLKR